MIERALWTFMLLPIVCVLATLTVSWLMSYISYDKARIALRDGLIITAISFAVAWAMCFISVVSIL